MHHVDDRRTDDLADRRHGPAHGGEERRAGVLHEKPAVRHLLRLRGTLRGSPRAAACSIVCDDLQSGVGRVGRHVVVTTRSQLSASACPACDCASSRVHSRYRRLVANLSSHGREVTIEISVRRFRCVEVSGHRRIFAERGAGRGVSRLEACGSAHTGRARSRHADTTFG